MAAYFSRTGGASAPTVPTLVPVQLVTSGNYNVQLTDYYIGCNGTGITVTLPLGSTVPTGKVYQVKDESGTATTNKITIAATSPNLIDGSPTVILSINYAAVTMLWTGTVWSII